jgi:RNA recognition motif-containing protein
MNIFVGNLARDVTEDDLQGAFGAYGRVTRATVLRDKFSGMPRGFGFVEMEVRAEAQAAITALNGSELKGRTLSVNEARPKAERAGSAARRPGWGGRVRSGSGRR